MEGPDSNKLFNEQTGKPYDFSGILPRLAIFIQSEIERYQRQFSQEIFIEVSALEIYCENVRDLLWQGGKKDGTNQRYVQIKTVGSKIACIGQTWIRVSSPKEFLNQIQISSLKRVFKNNGINPHSSRSHHVFQIRINSFDKLGKPQKSLLNIVDLAGSERRSTFYYDDEGPKKKSRNTLGKKGS